MKRISIAFWMFCWLHLATGQALEHAKVIDQLLKVEVKNEEQLHVTKKHTVQVFNEKGYRNALFIDYEDQFRKLTSFEMVVKDQSGKKVKSFGRGKVMDYSISQSFETTNANYVVLDPEYKNFPFTIEVTAEFNHNGFLNLPQWMPQDRYNVSVKESRLTVVAPSDYELRYKEENLSGMETISVNGGKDVMYTWSVKDLQAVDKDIDYRSFTARQPKVLLAPSRFVLDNNEGMMTSWKEFGDWFIQLNEGRDQLLPSTTKMLNELPEEDLETTVTKIYKYMQDRTRYVSIQLGIGGFQSLPADFVDEKGYGECKALTNYVKAMLKYKGIKSNYVLVRAGRDAEDIDYEFPSNQFNHVFLGVPTSSDTILLECTSQTIPPNYIGSFTDDRHVLWVEKENSKIINTPTYDETQNVYMKRADFQLDENGNATLGLKVTHKGVFFDKINWYNTYSSDQLNQYHNSLFNYRDFTVKKFEVNDKSYEAEFDCTYSLLINRLARKISGRMIFQANMLQALDFYVKPNKITRYLEIRRGFTVDESIFVRIPKNYRLDLKPEDLTITDDFGEYKIIFSDHLEGLMIKRKVVIKKGIYENERFDRFLIFIEKIEKMDKKKIVLGSKT